MQRRKQGTENTAECQMRIAGTRPPCEERQADRARRAQPALQASLAAFRARSARTVSICRALLISRPDSQNLRL